MIFRREPLLVGAFLTHSGYVQHILMRPASASPWSLEGNPYRLQLLQFMMDGFHNILMKLASALTCILERTPYWLQPFAHILAWCSLFSSRTNHFQYTEMQEPSIGYSLLDTFVYDVHLIDQTSAVFNIKHAEAPLSVTGLSALLDQKNMISKKKSAKPPYRLQGFLRIQRNTSSY